MKFFSTLSAIAASLVLCFSLSSCNKSDKPEEFKVQQQITDSFMHISDLSGMQSEMNYKGVSYQIIYDYVEATADVTIKGLKLPGDKQFPALSLTEIPFKVTNDGTRVLEGSNLAATSAGFADSQLFNQFKMTVSDRLIDGYYFPAVCIEYTVNSTYKAVGSIMSQIFVGTTVTTDSNGHSFSNETPVYALELDPQTMKAALTINNAKFIQSMPAQTMTFSGIPYTVSDSGIVTLESTETIIPTINKVEFKAFPITDLKAEYNLTTGMNLNFVCSIDKSQMKPEMADKIEGSPFTVDAKLPFVKKASNEAQ